MQAYRSSILHFVDDPDRVPERDAYQYFEDGILVVDDGTIFAVGAADELLGDLSEETGVEWYSGRYYP